MRIFDSFFLLGVSVFLCTKGLFFGVVILVLGLLIQFQNARVRLLLGSADRVLPTGRKVRAAIFSLFAALSLLPLLLGSNSGASAIEGVFVYDSLLPLVWVVALFSAAMMVALVVEKRKR